MNNMNVIIADDHPIVLFGIRKSLEQIEWVNVVGEFEDSTALINNLPKLDAHVLITDLSMPGDKYGDGITLIKYIKRHFPSLLEKISAGGYGDKRLSPKESEVLRLFAEGFLVTEIAKKLNRSIKTISSQKKSAMMKLGVENDIALLNYLSSVTLSPTDKE
ncbi:response regulator [Salmonella enterica]|nr:response regulator [Salmonella enterica]